MIIMEEETIAQRLGYTLTHVQNKLLLMSAPAAVRKMVEQDKVSASVAIDTLRKHGPLALDILNSASQESTVAGNADGRISPKQITRVREKSGVRVVKLPKSTLVKSIGWLKEQGLQEEPAVLRFLSFLAGMPGSDEVKNLVDRLLQQKAEKRVEGRRQNSRLLTTKLQRPLIRIRGC